MSVAASGQSQIRWHGHRPEIHVEGITLRPVKSEDLKSYQKLFQNIVAMERYAGGVRDITKRFQGWVDRWDLHSYSALAVVDDLSQKVIGHVVMGHGDYEGNLKNGWSEMALIIDPPFWNCDYKDVKKGIGTEGRKGIGTAVVRAIVAYARALKQRSQDVPCDVTSAQQSELKEKLINARAAVHRSADGQISWVYLPLKELRAITRCDNDASYKIFQKVFVAENKGSETPTADSNRRLFTIKL